MEKYALPSHLASLNEIEEIMGDPLDSDAIFFLEKVMESDEKELYPHELLDRMFNVGLMNYFVPKAYGGNLQSCPHCYYLTRSMATRDITTTIVFMLRSISNWSILVSGNEKQKKEGCRAILNGSGVSFGVTERDHGSDLINNSTRAEYRNGKYYLTGEKWPIGNCHHNSSIVVLAKTSDQDGPDSFSMFFVDMSNKNQSELKKLPLEKLYGLRAMDLSGVSLTQCEVSPDSVIGGKGKGLEVMLKAQQINRAGIISVSTGAMDKALRLTFKYASKRIIFGRSLAQTPVSKNQLIDVFTDLLLCEAQANFVSRALHSAPHLYFMWAALSKFIVPTLSENALLELSDVIGARHYLRDSFYLGFFQKLCRDNLSVGIVDGNKKVNLKNIAFHMEIQLSYFEKHGDSEGKEEDFFSNLFDILDELPEIEYEKLDIFSGRKDPVILNYKSSIIKLEKKLNKQGIPDEVISNILDYAKRAYEQIKNLCSEIKEKKELLGDKYNYSPESFSLAEKYSKLYLAPVCIHLAVYSSFTQDFNSFSWLLLCLKRVQRLIDPDFPLPSIKEQGEMFDLLENLHRKNLAFTFLPIKLPPSGKSIDEELLFNL